MELGSSTFPYILRVSLTLRFKKLVMFGTYLYGSTTWREPIPVGILEPFANPGGACDEP